MADQMEPQAGMLVKESRARLLDYMRHCQQEVVRHEAAAAFWQDERQTINRFLVENQMDDTSAAEEMDVPKVGRPTTMRDAEITGTRGW